MSAAAHEGRPGGSNREQRYSYPNKQGWSLLYDPSRDTNRSMLMQIG